MLDEFWKKWDEMFAALHRDIKKLPTTTVTETVEKFTSKDIEVSFLTDSERPISIVFPIPIRKVGLSKEAATILIEKLQKAVRASEVN